MIVSIKLTLATALTIIRNITTTINMARSTDVFIKAITGMTIKSIKSPIKKGTTANTTTSISITSTKNATILITAIILVMAIQVIVILVIDTINIAITTDMDTLMAATIVETIIIKAM